MNDVEEGVNMKTPSPNYIPNNTSIFESSKPSGGESDLELCNRLGLTNTEEVHNVLTQLIEQYSDEHQQLLSTNEVISYNQQDNIKSETGEDFESRNGNVEDVHFLDISSNNCSSYLYSQQLYQMPNNRCSEFREYNNNDCFNILQNYSNYNNYNSYYENL